MRSETNKLQSKPLLFSPPPPPYITSPASTFPARSLVPRAALAPVHKSTQEDQRGAQLRHPHICGSRL